MKRILALGLFLALMASFSLVWVDYQTKADITGFAFLSQSRWLLLALGLLALLLLVLGEYFMLSGLFVILFLAELFFGARYHRQLLAQGFYISLALTIATAFACLLIKDRKGRQSLRKQLKINRSKKDNFTS